MATQCLHKTMTKWAMDRSGFNDDAQDTAAEANSEIDKQQGNDASETNLHAMCAQTQSEKECREQVEILIDKGKQDVINAVLTADRHKGLVRLGQILHTIQDRAFHNFEAWPYSGLVDALTQNPNYMICHAIRDLGVVSDLDLQEINQGHFDIQLSWRIGRQIYISPSFFIYSHTYDPRLTGIDRNSPTRDFIGTGGLLSFSFGAPPGSLPKQPRPGQMDQSKGESPFWDFVTHGPAARGRAEDASMAFIMQIQTAVERTPAPRLTVWSDFLGKKP